MSVFSRFKRNRSLDEASNSFALFVVMLPMLLGAFGVGLDISRNVYIRTELQNALDLATVGGAAVTGINRQGNVVINDGKAIDAVEQIYAMNRGNAAELSCWGDQSNIEGTQISKCWKMHENPEIDNRYLYYGVRERSKNAFLTVIGIKWQEYRIESKAVVNQATQ